VKPNDENPLRIIGQNETPRVLSDEHIAADPERIADGWERRFIANGPRAEEMMRLYRELGFEVVADPVQAGHAGDDCEDCQVVIASQFKMIYTRRPKIPPPR